ncbi:hypothetical protein JCM8547_000149 [Rhodosporidiobolus lusitaniae]
MASYSSALDATINCDCGESFGAYKAGDDEGLFPLVDIANAACGFHASDFDVMEKTVALAKEHGVAIGAHPGFPDLQGFGRRPMTMSPGSFFNCLLYQIGALQAFLKLHGLPMNHIKPHGQAYMMSSKDLDLARQSAKIARLCEVPLLGLPGTAHQAAAEEEGVDFIPEWYADLPYDNKGYLMPAASAGNSKPHIALDQVYQRTRTMLLSASWLSFDGTTTLSFTPGVTKVSICVHGDLPGAVEVAEDVRRAINDVRAGK